MSKEGGGGKRSKKREVNRPKKLAHSLTSQLGFARKKAVAFFTKTKQNNTTTVSKTLLTGTYQKSPFVVSDRGLLFYCDITLLHTN